MSFSFWLSLSEQPALVAAKSTSKVRYCAGDKLPSMRAKNQIVGKYWICCSLC